MEDTIVQRIVCRADLGMNVAVEFMQDFKQCLNDLNNANLVFHNDNRKHHRQYGFAH